MQVVSVDNIQEGMMIGRDIFSPSGQFLVKKGAVVTKTLLKGLIKHGIINIAVRFENEGEATFSEQETLEAKDICGEKVLQRFHQKPSDPMMKLILETALRIEATEYLEKSNEHR